MIHTPLKCWNTFTKNIPIIMGKSILLVCAAILRSRSSITNGFSIKVITSVKSQIRVIYSSFTRKSYYITHSFLIKPLAR